MAGHGEKKREREEEEQERRKSSRRGGRERKGGKGRSPGLEPLPASLACFQESVHSFTTGCQRVWTLGWGSKGCRKWGISWGMKVFWGRDRG